MATCRRTLLWCLAVYVARSAIFKMQPDRTSSRCFVGHRRPLFLFALTTRQLDMLLVRELRRFCNLALGNTPMPWLLYASAKAFLTGCEFTVDQGEIVTLTVSAQPTACLAANVSSGINSQVHRPQSRLTVYEDSTAWPSGVTRLWLLGFDHQPMS